MSHLLQLLLNNQIFTGMLGASVVASVLFVLRGIPKVAWNWFIWRVTSKLVVFSDDPAFDMVINWLNGLEYAKRARQLRLDANYSEDQQANVTRHSPGFGVHLVWVGGRPVFVTRSNKETPGRGRNEEITISTFGLSPSLLHHIIRMIAVARDNASKTHIEVYVYREYWRLACRKEKRSLDTVVMPAEQRNRIVGDIDAFLNNKSWYRERGIPYRRGMLFVGPPGCGKTSFVMALASHYSKRIYALNIGSIQNDDRLIEAITTVPENAILLIEDIDAAQSARSFVKSNNDHYPVVPVVPGNKAMPSYGQNSQPITLSGLLNAIDGVFSRDGRILIMTTNHADKIDPALKRPGRADRTELFDELHYPLVLEMCKQFVGDRAVSVAKGIRVPITPAELQCILLGECGLEPDAKAAE